MRLPILMYHYVRPRENWLSKRHNVLELDLFNAQLGIIKKDFFFFDSKGLFCEKFEDSGNEKPIWLTFDDGYKDCINHVLPSLLDVGARATFYIPTEAVFDRKLLDVNKIHIILSNSKSPKQIVGVCSEIFDELNLGQRLSLSFDDLFLKYGHENLWNDAETEFLKKLFQRALPTDARNQLLEKVFSQVVSRHESSWVDEFYLTPDDVAKLHECGMEIGSHSHSHLWLEDLSENHQKNDIEESFRLLESVVGSLDHRTMCYPFGSYNSETLKILSELDVYTAVKNSENRIADINSSDTRQLELDRIDVMFFDEFISGEFEVAL